MKILSNSQVGTYRGIHYGMEDDGVGSNLYYFETYTGKFKYADNLEELESMIDKYLDSATDRRFRIPNR